MADDGDREVHPFAHGLMDPGPFVLMLFLAAATLAMVATGRTIALIVFAVAFALDAAFVGWTARRRLRARRTA